MCGYHVVFWALKTNAKKDLLHRLDADSYAPNDVIVLTLPVSLPYSIYDPGYERASGEVEYRGEFYHLVKQKVENDTLFMICVKDQEQKRIENTKAEYMSLSNGLAAGETQTLDLLSKLFKDYTSPSIGGLSKHLVLKYDILFAVDSYKITQHVFAVDSPPPELG